MVFVLHAWFFILLHLYTSHIICMIIYVGSEIYIIILQSHIESPSLPASKPLYLPVNPLQIYQLGYLPAYQPTTLPACLPANKTTNLSANLPTCLPA